MRGETFTGSMSWTTGQGAESRWLYITGSGQSTRILTADDSGPGTPAVANIFKTDLDVGKSLGLYIKTTKTAHVNATSFDGTGGFKRIYAWCGADETHPCQMQYQGAGSSLPYIRQGSIATGFTQIDLNASALMQNSEGVNAVGHTIMWFGLSENHLWVDGLGWVGVHIRFKPIDGQTFSGVNTWSVEANWIYGD